MDKDHKDKNALLIIDMQNDFLEGGSLPVKDGNSIIPLINEIHIDESIQWKLTVLTADWHPTNHFSFHVNN
jgi:nicotinamidase-related amidase